MSFGFSINDILTAAQLAHKVRKDFSNAPSQFKSLSDETKLLSMVLQDVDVKLDESDLTAQQEANLEQAMSTCGAVLHDLQAVCDKFSDLDTTQSHSRKSIRRVWKKLKWEPNEGRELRERVSSSITMLTTLLNQLSGETTVAVKKGVDRLNQCQDHQERLDILNWLSSVDHMAQQNDISARKQAGTGAWLLESPEFASWKSTKGETLFCPGIPGAGKTILSSIVVEELTKQFEDDSTVCVAYVYFNYQQQDNQTIERVFANLLRQLVAGRSDIPAAVGDLYMKHLKRASKPTFEEIRKLLRSFSSLYSRVFVIVDALDECPSRDGRRNTLLAEIMKLQTALLANVMCTSRPIPEIEAWFPHAVSIKVRASEHDVRKYLDGQLGCLPGFVARNPKLQRQVKNQIVKVVNGMFLLAHLHLESLMYKRTPKALRTALEGLPRGSMACDDTYKKTMERVQSQFPDQAELAKDVLQWIVCARVPLSVSELQHALAVEIGQEYLDLENLPDADDMVTACGGLVTIDQNRSIIRLVHFTTQEYFERTRNTWFPTAEDHMGGVCLTYLSLQPFRSRLCESEGELRLRLWEWPFHRYTSIYWVEHARRASLSKILAFFELEGAFQSSLVHLSKPRYFSQRSVHEPWNLYSTKPGNLGGQHVTQLHIAAWFGLGPVVHKLALRETVDEMTAWGWTPLAFATDGGHDAVIRLLLIEHGADANIPDENGMAPLHHAVFNGHIDSFKILVEVGEADPWLGSHVCGTPLWLAVERGQLEILNYFIKTFGAYQGSTLKLSLILSKAAEEDYDRAVKALVVSLPNLDLDICTKSSCLKFHNLSPFARAARNGHNKVCKILLDTGRVNVNLTDSNGRTALSHAIEEGYDEIIDMLLQTDNIYIHSTESEDQLALRSSESGAHQSPLFCAVKQGNEHLVKKLLAMNGVDPNATLLGVAISTGHLGVTKVLLSGPIFDTNAQDEQGRILLSYAAEKGWVEVIQALLQRYNADANSIDHKQKSPLLYAAAHGHEQVVETLLQIPNIDVNPRDHKQRTPLSYAAEYGHDQVIEALLQTPSIDVNSKDEKQRTALSYAAEYSPDKVVEALLRAPNIDIDSKAADIFQGSEPFEEIKAALDAVCGTPLCSVTGVPADSESLEDVIVALNAAGRTPLSFAAERGHVEIVQRLLDTGQVDPDASGKGSLCRTPLTWVMLGLSDVLPMRKADAERFEAVAGLLLRTKRVNVNSRCTLYHRDQSRDGFTSHEAKSGQTPLLIATGEWTPPSMIKLLLENEANTNATSDDGATPLSNAIKRGDRMVADMLVEYGAKPLEL